MFDETESLYSCSDAPEQLTAQLADLASRTGDVSEQVMAALIAGIDKQVEWQRKRHSQSLSLSQRQSQSQRRSQRRSQSQSRSH